MRRFEFVEGSSSKFWEPELKGSTFTVTYGRIGTAGQRKEKAFPDEAAARREYEKKVAEKQREGYREVTAGAGDTAAPPPSPTPQKVPLPRRVPRATPTPEAVKAAAAALAALRARLGWRSWEVTSRARRARRALRALGGVDPAAHPELAGTFAALMERVVAAPREGRLPLRHALSLLGAVDAAAFLRATEVWRRAGSAVPGATALAGQATSLGEPELALRLGMLLAERPGESGALSEEGWAKRWAELRPHVESHLSSAGGSLAAWVKGVDAGGGCAPHPAAGPPGGVNPRAGATGRRMASAPSRSEAQRVRAEITKAVTGEDWDDPLGVPATPAGSGTREAE